ncbi:MULTISPECIES: hypothetical protein [Streptomyces violaceoruber group]|uniref:Uncharacterized protein n=1 Tax=Streptomyces rubrogriseus TaxID=194673 RepID=A0A6G3TEN4_9ACTN|nr:hypothetical protein [Streptomyces anthocyanicus]NEC35006.1 hypothetical protein [Streptomyces rubrogriseus]WSB66407.1 hypothetical protein OIE72_40205 [Streptomyces anthocyanicus]
MPAPAVRIGVVEVRIAAPVPPPAADVVRPQAAAPAGPVPRLSRPGVVFGLGQG